MQGRVWGSGVVARIVAAVADRISCVWDGCLGSTQRNQRSSFMASLLGLKIHKV